MNNATVGNRTLVGMGAVSVTPDLDFETYSEAGFLWDEESAKWVGLPGAPAGRKGISVVGAERYSAHPSCEVLSLRYDLKDGHGHRGWLPGQSAPHALFSYLYSGGLMEAWNVAFERWVWEKVCVPRYGWPAVHPSQWRCAMAKSRAFSLPGALGKAAVVLCLPTLKGPEGDRLIKKFSVPRNPTKANAALRLRPQDDPVDFQRFVEYNDTDVVVESLAS